MHVVFGWTAYGMLRNVLRARGSPDTVARLADDLSWGPIAGSMAARIRGLNETCPVPWGWDWIAREHRQFRKAVEQGSEQKLIWIGTNCPSELAAYLVYLDRYAELPADVVRPDDYLPPHPKYGPAGSVGILSIEHLEEVLDRAERRPVAHDRRLFGRWKVLQSENAPLRVIEDGELVSAPVDRFDRMLIAAASREWQGSTRVVGTALGAAFDERARPNPEFLFARLAALAEAGKLEAQGNLLGWTDEGPREKAQVRLPA